MCQCVCRFFRFANVVCIRGIFCVIFLWRDNIADDGGDVHDDDDDEDDVDAAVDGWHGEMWKRKQAWPDNDDAETVIGWYDGTATNWRPSGQQAGRQAARQHPISLATCNNRWQPVNKAVGLFHSFVATYTLVFCAAVLPLFFILFFIIGLRTSTY